MKRSMDDLLRDTLRNRAADPTAACLDPETAAAFVDGTMSARGRASAEAHVAVCPRCQAVLAALVRSTPPPIDRAWWRRPAIAWLVPATVAAAAVMIWINIPDTANRAPVQAGRDEPALLASSPVQPTPSGVPAAPEAQSKMVSSADARSLAERVRAREATDASAKARLARVAADAASRSGDARQSAAPQQGQQGQAGASPPPAALRKAPAADARTAVEPNAGRALAAEPIRASAVAETAAPATFTSAPAAKIVSANGTSQWRIDAGGQVQHSTDGGSTWRPQATGANVTLAAGSSPSPSVCWLVGPGGLILITTDEGQSWRRVSFPAVTDLVSVRATDDRSASVMAADGRTFSTSDGGRTWRP